MTLSFLPLLHLWLILAIGKHPSAPLHGNQYYSYWNAKYLGCDSTSGHSYRLIDDKVYNYIESQDNHLRDPYFTNTLWSYSREITIDDSLIQADLQWVRDTSIKMGKENQVYIFLDRNSGHISSMHGQPGTDSKSTPDYESWPKYYVSYPKHDSTEKPVNMNRILIAQIHGHPKVKGRGYAPGMSESDSIIANQLEVPIYAVDAKKGEQGMPGAIYRVDPDSPRDTMSVGQTKGRQTGTTNGLFNLGQDALLIWGQSPRPWVAAHDSAAHHCRQPRPTTP